MNDTRNAEQLVAAQPEISAWVPANAGTGKTRVLVNRIIRLLLAGAAPGRILCLTFTKAAAAEMAERLNDTLGKWAVADDETVRQQLIKLIGSGEAPDDAMVRDARRLFARCLEFPGGLKIQTIHAFCESLLKRFPLEAGVSPHFSVLDERTAGELRDEVQTRLIERAFAGQPDLTPVKKAIETCIAISDEGSLADALKDLMNKAGRFQAMRVHWGDDAALIDAMRQSLGVAPGETKDSILEAACNDMNFNASAMRDAVPILQAGKTTDQDVAKNIAPWLAADPDIRKATFETTYAQGFLTQKLEPRSHSRWITKIIKDNHPGLFADMCEEQNRVAAVADKLRALTAAQASEALITIGGRMLDAFEAAKVRRAQLEYDDLIAKTEALLARDGGVSWAMYKLDGGIDHILVDEAQDTSPAQWQLIQHVADEFFTGDGRSDILRTLFVVGDEKQSIYSFQGADPDGFEAMRNHFTERAKAAKRELQTVELALSYRTTWSVLQTVDRTFEPEAARRGLGIRKVLHRSNRQDQAGLVEIWDTVKPDPEDPEDPWDAPLDQKPKASPESKLAERIARQIHDWIADGEILESRKRAMRPGDILVLVRRRTSFVERLIRELKHLNVPVAGADRMVLTEQLAVMDLMALARFALLPDDDLTLAVVLKSPFVGLDEEALFALAHNRKGKRLWSALKQRRSETSAYDAACAFLETILAAADSRPPYEFFERVLGEARGREKLLHRLGPDAADPIEEFLNLALLYEREHPPSLQGFLAWIEAGSAEIKREMEQVDDAVRIMTVHGAKGLEGNVVILPDTCRGPEGRSTGRLLWTTDQTRPLLYWPLNKDNLTAPTTDLRTALDDAEAEEYRRLLYVAMTRARDRLYVCGWEAKNRKRPPNSWYDLVLAAVQSGKARELQLADGLTAWRVEQPQTGEPDGTEQTESTGAKAAALPAWTGRGARAEPEPLKTLIPSGPDTDAAERRSPFVAADAQAFQKGLIVHRLLQTLPDISPDQREKRAARFLARPSLGLSGTDQKTLLAEALSVLTNPDWSHLFGPDSLAECPIVGQVGDLLVSGQIDRLAVAEDAVWVVDYKTTRPVPNSPEDTPEAYRRQMATYRAVLSRVYPDRPVRCLILWTASPSLMELPDPILTQSAP